MLLVQYQHRLGRNCTLAAVIACSASWDPHVTARVLETQFFNNLFYSRTLANDLKDLFNRSETISWLFYMIDSYEYLMLQCLSLAICAKNRIYSARVVLAFML